MEENDAWIATIKARGLGGAMRIALDAFAPFGPLGAQLLWVAQPAGALLGLSGAIDKLAHILEDPAEIEKLRQQLEDSP
jgi:hypothetical protein